jgi:hypothetical protein
MEGSFCFCGRNLGKGRIHQHIQSSPHEIPPRKERKEAQATALHQVAIRLPRRSGDRSGAFAARLGPDSQSPRFLFPSLREVARSEETNLLGRQRFRDPALHATASAAQALFTSPSQPKIFPLLPITSNLSTETWSIKCR